MGAGALWGLVFLAPEIVPGFSPLEQAVGRYLAYGLMSVLLVAPRWRAIPTRPSSRRRAWRSPGTCSTIGCAARLPRPTQGRKARLRLHYRIDLPLCSASKKPSRARRIW